MPNENEIEHIWTILSEKTVIDQRSNNVSFFEVLEQYSIELQEKAKEILKDGEPIVISCNLYITTLWQRNSDKKKSAAMTLIELHDPKGKILSQKNYEIHFKDQQIRTRIITQASLLPFTVPGIYWFKIFLEKEPGGKKTFVGKVPLQINREWVIQK